MDIISIIDAVAILFGMLGFALTRGKENPWEYSSVSRNFIILAAVFLVIGVVMKLFRHLSL
jgi:hypothetical protein